MTRRPLVDALTDAIERVAVTDPGLLTDVHVAAIGRGLVEGGSLNLRLAARDLAGAIDRDIEAAKLGRGRVTDRRLDQRVAKRTKP